MASYAIARTERHVVQRMTAAIILMAYARAAAITRRPILAAFVGERLPYPPLHRSAHTDGADPGKRRKLLTTTASLCESGGFALSLRESGAVYCLHSARCKIGP